MAMGRQLMKLSVTGALLAAGASPEVGAPLQAARAAPARVSPAPPSRLRREATPRQVGGSFISTFFLPLLPPPAGRAATAIPGRRDTATYGTSTPRPERPPLDQAVAGALTGRAGGPAGGAL